MSTSPILAEAYLVDIGCPWDMAEEAVEEAVYKLQHEDDPGKVVMCLISAWHSYCHSPLGEGVHSPGFLIASRVKELRTPPSYSLTLAPEVALAARWVGLVLDRLQVPELESHQSPQPARVLVRPSRP
jgi:hypothetical protein